MGKTLSELAGELKAFLIELQSDARNKHNFRPERYNNLKFSMDVAKSSTPYVEISISMSEAEFSLRGGEKQNGGLGPDERYVLRWLEKPNTLPALMECWREREKRRGKATDVED